MPALNFQKQFVEKVESGKKRQTVRAMRKRPFKVGDTLYLYYGQRTKQCRKIAEIKCSMVKQISITKECEMLIEGHLIEYHWREMIAKGDGFDSYNEMISWFNKTHGLPFTGQLIRW